MPIKQMDPRAVFEAMKNDKKAVLLDVRTTQEFKEGHPEGAINIPIRILDEGSGMMLPNSDFSEVVTALIPKDAVVYATCRSGQRSMMAAMQMEVAGYGQLINVRGGFEGSSETDGWRDQDLPTSSANGPGVSYESLLAKAKGGSV